MAQEKATEPMFAAKLDKNIGSTKDFLRKDSDNKVNDCMGLE